MQKNVLTNSGLIPNFPKCANHSTMIYFMDCSQSPARVVLDLMMSRITKTRKASSSKLYSWSHCPKHLIKYFGVCPCWNLNVFIWRRNDFLTLLPLTDKWQCLKLCKITLSELTHQEHVLDKNGLTVDSRSHPFEIPDSVLRVLRKTVFTHPVVYVLCLKIVVTSQTIKWYHYSCLDRDE